VVLENALRMILPGRNAPFPPPSGDTSTAVVEHLSIFQRQKQKQNQDFHRVSQHRLESDMLQTAFDHSCAVELLKLLRIVRFLRASASVPSPLCDPITSTYQDLE
jgi:hypothetical protein